MSLVSLFLFKGCMGWGSHTSILTPYLEFLGLLPLVWIFHRIKIYKSCSIASPENHTQNASIHFNLPLKMKPRTYILISESLINFYAQIESKLLQLRKRSRLHGQYAKYFLGFWSAIFFYFNHHTDHFKNLLVQHILCNGFYKCFSSSI